MAISLGFSPADLARCRFAISPLFETLSAIRDATGPQAPATTTAGSTASGRHWPAHLEPIVLLQPRRGYTPDFSHRRRPRRSAALTLN